MWYVFYTLDVYEVTDKAQLAAALLLGGMGIWGNTSALVWSNVPSPLSLRHKAVAHLARCLCFFRRAGFSMCFSIVTGTMGCSNTALAKSPQDLSAAPRSRAWAAANKAWQLWVSREPPEKLQAPSALLPSPGSLSQEQRWPWPCVVPGRVCWDYHSPFPTPGTLPMSSIFWLGKSSSLWDWEAAQSLNCSSE